MTPDSSAPSISADTWSQVDGYISDLFSLHDSTLEAALRASSAAGLPEIQVSPPQGKLLHMLARQQKARAILEVGTLGGYSTIWLARGLEPGGRVITLEVDPKHAEVARANFANAGLAGSIDLRLGKALETLPRIAEEGLGPFDLIFIDANKENNKEYFEWALKLSRRGSLILVDNVVRSGSVLDASSTDAAIKGTRRVLERMASEPRVTATIIQTVGVKGYDGFAAALVIADA